MTAKLEALRAYLTAQVAPPNPAARLDADAEADRPRGPLVMILYDAGLGDTIAIPAHWPPVVTVQGWQGTIVGSYGNLRDFTMLEWSAPGAKGTTLLSDQTVITRVAEADPEVKARMQAELEAQMEAAFAVMLAAEDD